MRRLHETSGAWLALVAASHLPHVRTVFTNCIPHRRSSMTCRQAPDGTSGQAQMKDDWMAALNEGNPATNLRTHFRPPQRDACATSVADPAGPAAPELNQHPLCVSVPLCLRVRFLPFNTEARSHRATGKSGAHVRFPARYGQARFAFGPGFFFWGFAPA